MKKKQNRKRTVKAKKGAWFIPVRGSYLPWSWQGWLTYIPYTAYLVFTIIVAFAYTGNTLKAVLWIVPNAVAAAIIMTWVAKQKS